MIANVTETPSKCATQTRKAKSPRAKLIAKLSRYVRQAGLSYEDWRYVARRVRQKCELSPAKKPKKLPRVLSGDEFRRFYKTVDAAEKVEHALLLRLMFYTGVRVSELCNIEMADVDLEGCKIFIREGKGSKDRYVLFGRSFAVALRTHMAAHPRNRWLFQSRRNTHYSTRRIQQIVKGYAEQAGVKASPHLFRHQCLTWLTKNSGLADAELQLISGHSQRTSLQIYQHMAVDGQLADRYQQAMKDVEL